MKSVGIYESGNMLNMVDNTTISPQDRWIKKLEEMTGLKMALKEVMDDGSVQVVMWKNSKKEEFGDSFILKNKDKLTAFDKRKSYVRIRGPIAIIRMKRWKDNGKGN